MLKAMVLTKEQMQKYSFTQIKQTNTKNFSYTKDEFYKDCKNRKKQSCKSFEYTNSGFTAEIDRKNINGNTLVFSVYLTKRAGQHRLTEKMLK